MGIQLDWEVESDSGNSAVAEDAAVIAAEKRRAKLNRGVLIMLAIVLIIGGAIAAYRAKIVRDEKLRVLHLTVEAETLALRIGDVDKFMSLQGPADDWRAEQRAHFDQMVAEPDVLVEGTILDLEMTNSEARVVIGMQVDGQPAQAVWLYEYLDKGWKHTNTEAEPWSELTDVTGSFTFTYTAMDQAAVDDLKALLTEWWTLAADATHADDLPHLTIKLSQDGAGIGEVEDDAHMLVISSDLFTDGELLPVHRNDFARLASVYWAEHVIGESVRVSYSSEDWLSDETALWLEEQFGGSPERTSALTHLSASFGEDFIPTFFTLNHKTGEPLDSLRSAMQQTAPRQYTTPYFESYLEAVSTLMSVNRDGNVNVEFDEMPLIEQDLMTGGSMTIGTSMLSGVQPGSIKVDDVRMFEGVYWVSGTMSIDGMMYGIGPEGSAPQTTRFIIPFREVDGYTQIGAVGDEAWGRRLTEQTPYVILEYTELDAPYLSGTAASLEQDYLKAAAMFGLTNTPQITIQVAKGFEDPDVSTEGFAPVMLSPHIMCCFPGYDAREFARLFFMWQLYSTVFNQAAGGPPEEFSAGAALFESALVLEAAERSGHDLRLFYGPSSADLDITELELPDTLESLWYGAESFSMGPYDWELRQVGAQSLVAVLIDRYGQQAISLLTPTLRQSTTLEGWLESSLGITPAEVEADWRVRYREDIQRIYGD